MKDALNYQCCSFGSHILEYFKKYVAILKVKCLNLLEILDYLEKIKSMKISKDEWDALVDLDIYVNEEGNNLNTYLDFKNTKEQLGRDDFLMKKKFILVKKFK